MEKCVCYGHDTYLSPAGLIVQLVFQLPNLLLNDSHLLRVNEQCVFLPGKETHHYYHTAQHEHIAKTFFSRLHALNANILFWFNQVNKL